MFKRIWRLVRDVFGRFGRGRRGRGSSRDPFAWKPAPVRPRPKTLTGSVALAEPDDETLQS
jgi:hypothetical protein